MGANFNVSLTVRGKVNKTVHKSQKRERRAETESNRGPSACQPKASPLGQSGSTRDTGWLSVALRPQEP